MFSRHHKSKMVLAVDGGRGPPEGKKRDLFLRTVTGFRIVGGEQMSLAMQKKQYKNPPIHEHDGRGPPEREKRDFAAICPGDICFVSFRCKARAEL